MARPIVGSTDTSTSTQQTKPFTFWNALGMASKRMGQSVAGGLLEIPKGIVRAGLTPIGMAQEAASGTKKIEKRSFQLPKILETITGQNQEIDYTAPSTFGDVASRSLDVSMVPGFGVGTAARAIAPNLVAKAGKTATKMFPRLSPEYKTAKAMIQNRNLALDVGNVQFKREAKQNLKPLVKTGEMNDFINVVTGKATPLKPTEKLGKAVEWYADVAKRQEEGLLKRGMTKDIVDERKYLELRTLTGKSTQEIKDTLGLKPDAAVKIAEAIKTRKPFEPLYMPIQMTDIPNWSQIYFSQFLKKPGKPSFIKKATGAGVVNKNREMDAFKVITQRHIKEQKEVLENQLVQDISTKFGKPFEGTVPEGYTLWKPEGSIRFYPSETGVGVTKKGVKEYVIPKSVQDAYNTWNGGQAIRNKYFQNSMKVIDGITNLWKMTILPLRPAWMATNTVGNITLNTVGHVSPTSYAKALLPKYKKLFSKESLENLGVKGLTGIADVRTGAFKEATQTLYKPNQWIENYFRWVHFIDKAGKFAKTEANAMGQRGNKDVIMNLIKNSDEIQGKAVGEVNKYLFNYSALSNMEKDITRRVIPFYTWIKNISRLTGQMAVDETSTLAKVYTFYNKLRSGTSDDEGLPDYLKGSVKTGLAMNTDGKIIEDETDESASPLYWNWKYLFPFYDVGNIGLGSLTPLLKIPIERATGKQLFAQEAKEFTAPAYISKFEKAPEPPKGLANLVKPTLTYQNKELVSAKPSIARHVLNQFSPYRLYQGLAKPYAQYSATGEPIKNKYGKIKYPKTRGLELMKYLTAMNLTPYKKK